MSTPEKRAAEDAVKNETVVTDSNVATELVVADKQPALFKMPKEDFMAKLKRAQEADKEAAPEAGTKYWEAEKGKEITGIFLGFKAITAKDGDRAGEILPAPVIQISEYQAYISAAVQLAGSFQIIPLGAAVYVKCDESKSGQAALFTVKVLEA